MSKHIEIYINAIKTTSDEWRFHVIDGQSGAITGRAEKALVRLIENVEAVNGDADAIRETIGFKNGDTVRINAGGGSMHLGDFLEVEG